MLISGFALVILVAFLRLLVAIERPAALAGGYALIFLALGFFAGDPWWAVLVSTAITFGVIFAYFWLLVRFLGQGAVFWAILVGGLLAPALVRMVISG